MKEKILQLEDTNQKLLLDINELLQSSGGDPKKVDNKIESLRKEVLALKKAEKESKKKATADAVLISKQEATISAMAVQTDAASKSSSSRKVTGKGKRKLVSGGSTANRNNDNNDSSSSTSEDEAEVELPKKKRTQRKIAVEDNNDGNSSDDKLGITISNILFISYFSSLSCIFYYVCCIDIAGLKHSTKRAKKANTSHSYMDQTSCLGGGVQQVEVYNFLS